MQQTKHQRQMIEIIEEVTVKSTPVTDYHYTFEHLI